MSRVFGRTEVSPSFPLFRGVAPSRWGHGIMAQNRNRGRERLRQGQKPSHDMAAFPLAFRTCALEGSGARVPGGQKRWERKPTPTPQGTWSRHVPLAFPPMPAPTPPPEVVKGDRGSQGNSVYVGGGVEKCLLFAVTSHHPP